MAKFRMRRKKINVGRIVAKVVGTVIALYVGGTIMSELGDVMNGTTSPFYQGLTLIGWTVSDAGQITATTGSGVLAVIGIIGIGSLVTEFVTFSM